MLIEYNVRVNKNDVAVTEKVDFSSEAVSPTAVVSQKQLGTSFAEGQSAASHLSPTGFKTGGGPGRNPGGNGGGLPSGTPSTVVFGPIVINTCCCSCNNSKKDIEP